MRRVYGTKVTRLTLGEPSLCLVLPAPQGVGMSPQSKAVRPRMVDGRAIELAASVGDGLVEIGERVEILVGDRLIDERPEAFRRLQLGTVGRQEDEFDSVGNIRSGGTVPPGIVEDKNDDAISPGAGLFDEFGKHRLEEGLVHHGREVPDGFAAGRLNKGGQMKPLEAMVTEPR